MQSLGTFLLTLSRVAAQFHTFGCTFCWPGSNINECHNFDQKEHVVSRIVGTWLCHFVEGNLWCDWEIRSGRTQDPFWVKIFSEGFARTFYYHRKITHERNVTHNCYNQKKPETWVQNKTSCVNKSYMIIWEAEKWQTYELWMFHKIL